MIQARRKEKLESAKSQLAQKMSDVNPRIRIHNSSGTFEVSLISVDEAKGTVVVLWDGNIQREFKWGSVVWDEKKPEPKVKPVDIPKARGKPKGPKKGTAQRASAAPAQGQARSSSNVYPPSQYFRPPPGSHTTNSSQAGSASGSGSSYPTYSSSQYNVPPYPVYPGYSYSYYYPTYKPAAPGKPSDTPQGTWPISNPVAAAYDPSRLPSLNLGYRPPAPPKVITARKISNYVAPASSSSGSGSGISTPITPLTELSTPTPTPVEESKSHSEAAVSTDVS